MRRPDRTLYESKVTRKKLKSGLEDDLSVDPFGGVLFGGLMGSTEDGSLDREAIGGDLVGVGTGRKLATGADILIGAVIGVDIGRRLDDIDGMRAERVFRQTLMRRMAKPSRSELSDHFEIGVTGSLCFSCRTQTFCWIVPDARRKNTLAWSRSIVDAIGKCGIVMCHGHFDRHARFPGLQFIQQILDQSEKPYIADLRVPHALCRDRSGQEAEATPRR